MYKILIIDDEEIARKTIIKIISTNMLDKTSLFEAENAAEAADIINNISPDIIISDICLGRTNGLDLLETIKPSSKLIILTGYRNFEYARRSISINVSSFLLKPVRPNILIDAVSDAMKSLDNERSHSIELKRLNSILTQNLPYIKQKVLLDMIYGISAGNTEVGDEALAMHQLK